METGTQIAEIPGKAQPISEQHARELWVSLASLLRSYTAAHGLNGTTQATVELGDDEIRVRCGQRWLRLARTGGRIEGTTQDGQRFGLFWSEAGELLTETGDGLPMDLQAEEWSRELVA